MKYANGSGTVAPEDVRQATHRGHRRRRKGERGAGRVVAAGFADNTAYVPSTASLASLKAHSDGEYVTAGASPLIANRTAIGQWEEFDLIYD